MKNCLFMNKKNIKVEKIQIQIKNKMIYEEICNNEFKNFYNIKKYLKEG